MRKQLLLLSAMIIAGAVFYMSCNSGDEKTDEPAATNEPKKLSHEELIKLGDYIVTTGGCNDCHSPKVMTAHGPAPDSSRLLSGHPANMPLPPLDDRPTKPGNWMYMSPSITAFVGPWGVSYAANLTPDSTTGIGSWTEENFILALRSGKHLGAADGKPILPPMPWFDIGKKTDEDLKAMYAYLKSLPPVKNAVPTAIPPTQFAKK